MLIPSMPSLLSDIVIRESGASLVLKRAFPSLPGVDRRVMSRVPAIITLPRPLLTPYLPPPPINTSMPTSSSGKALPGSSPNNPSTVIYDEEASQPLDELAPPDLDAILNRKRKWHHRIFNFQLPRHYQMILTGTSIVLSAVQANGVYCWPT